MPWTLTDNAICWLEPTAKCNLKCEGCYRANIDEHKSLEEVSADLDVFAKYRNFDSISIAGGDPLCHPQVVDIVKMIADRGWKPTLNTNGLALTPEILHDLKKAGLKALTFHIDSKQHRPNWKGKTEQEINELRLHFAEMVAREGGMLCVFNSTVYEDTLDAVPDLCSWAQEHIDIVHTMVFICYREAAIFGDYDYYAGDEKVDMGKLVYIAPETQQRVDIDSQEVVDKIRERYPDFSPCAYLGGTEKPDSFKWLITSRLGTKKKIYGYMGPKMMELTQSIHHATTGHYMAYSTPKMTRKAKSMIWLWPFDKGLRRTFGKAFFDPALTFRRMHLQSIVVIQPIDILPDGRQNMCDGCPDITVHEGRLAWSCRLEECLHFGQFVRTVPRKKAAYEPPRHLEVAPPPKDLDTEQDQPPMPAVAKR